MSGALVPLTPVVRESAPLFPWNRPHAAFVAHLIATAMAVPQTRMRRRAEPAEAAAIYGQVYCQARAQVGQWPMPSRRLLSQSL